MKCLTPEAKEQLIVVLNEFIRRNEQEIQIIKQGPSFLASIDKSIIEERLAKIETIKEIQTEIQDARFCIL